MKGQIAKLMSKANIDSFNKLYEQLSRDYLKPLYMKLPKDEEIGDIVKEVFTKGQKSLRK
jgi:hypothetical protein